MYNVRLEGCRNWRQCSVQSVWLVVKARNVWFNDHPEVFLSFWLKPQWIEEKTEFWMNTDEEREKQQEEEEEEAADNFYRSLSIIVTITGGGGGAGK